MIAASSSAVTVAESLECRPWPWLHDFVGQLVGEDQLLARLRAKVVLGASSTSIEAIGDRATSKLMARLPGMVHGVVVQMTTNGVLLQASVSALRAHRKLHPDRVALDVGVLDLGFGQRRALDHRPHDRLGAAIELAGHGELQQLAGDAGFGVEAHRRIGIVQVAVDAEPLELFALDLDPVGGEVAAFLAEFVDRDVVLVLALGAVLLPRSSIRSAGRGSPSPAHSWSRSRASGTSG